MITFGPVPSRRLGKSLGINNIPSGKQCSYSCIYCQIGITRRQSIERKPFYEPDTLLNAVRKHLEKLKPEYKPDYLTFVANGEPTLDIYLGKEIRMLKEFGIPIVVITNASLLHRAKLREELEEADWVSVKVDAVDTSIWKTINQPEIMLNLPNILSGIEKFAKTYKGKLHTETMMLDGINDARPQIARTASFIASLHPEKAYISIPSRPTPISTIKPPPEEKLVAAWQIFHALGIPAELLTGFEGTDTGATGNAYEDILSIIAVHPLHEDTLLELLRRNHADSHVVHSLIHQGLVKPVMHEGRKFYIRCYHAKLP